MMARLSARQRVSVAMLLGSLCFAALAAENPYDKFRNHSYSNHNYLSEEQELQLGAEVHKQLRKEHQFVEHPALNSYINSLGQRLAAHSARPDIPYHFFVIDDRSINAFATLGGYVYVHTGLLATTLSEAQLASVLGHEIGHIAARHGLENVKRAQKYGIIAGLIGAATGAAGRTAGDLGELTAGLILGGKLMQHSREAEREADYLSLYDVQRAGYSTGGMVELFETLRSVEANRPDLLGPIMRSHPPAGERAANTRSEIVAHLPGSDRRGIETTPDFQRIKARFEPNAPPRERPRD